jgi:hypothetical protein
MKKLKVIAIAGAAIILQAHSWYTGKTNDKGEICCGGTDCAELPDESVTNVEGGWWVSFHGEFAFKGNIDIEEFVPFTFGQVADLESAHYSMCVVSGKIRCFFYPSPGY